MKTKDTETAKSIVLYIGSLERGGAEHVLVNLAEYFCEQGWRVTMVTTYRHPEEYRPKRAGWPVTEPDGGRDGLYTPAASWPAEAGVSIGRVYSGLLPEEEKGNRISRAALRVKKLRRTFTDLKPDVILSFLGKNNIMSLLSTVGTKIPVIVSVRSNPSREYGSRGLYLGMRLLFPGAAAVVLQTSEAKRWFPPSVEVKSVIMPNALDERFLRPLYEGERERTVVSVGRLDDNKNQGLLIRAFAATQQKHPEYRLKIYGDGPSGEKFKALASSLGIAEVTEFAGNVPDVPERIEKAGIFVLPSRQEGMPNALLEAMALGIPCISTDCPCGGPADIIRFGENGLLVPVDDEETLTRALLKCMDDPGGAAKMGRKGSEIREKNAPDVVHGYWKELVLAVTEPRT